MSDGKITFKTKIDNSDVEKDLNQTKKKIQKAEEEIAKAENAKLPLTKQSDELCVALDIAKEKMARLKAESESIRADMQPGVSPDRYIEAAARKGDVDASIKQQQKEVNSLQKKWDAVNNKLDIYDAKIKSANADLAKNKAKAGELSAKLSKGGIDMSGAMAAAGRMATTFKRRLSEIARQALLFTFIAKGFQAFVTQMSKALNMNAQYRQELAKLKGALLTAFQPLFEMIMPGLLAVMRILTAIVSVVANVLSILTGKSMKQSAKAAENMQKEQSAIKGVGAAAEKAKKQLASFDEINQLDAPDPGGGGGVSAGVPNAAAPDFGAFDTAEYKAKIDELTVYLSGALLALGAILTFSGANIPLGIGLMVAGAIGLAAEIKENWNAMDSRVGNAITLVMTVLGGAALVIGAILAFSGANLPLGIGLMVAGAAALGGVVALNWETVVKNLQGTVGKIVAVVSSVVLAIGAVLAFSGANLPLGIGLMAAGAVGLAATAAVNWSKIKNALQGELGAVTGFVSAALLAIGVILVCSGFAMPLGIALIGAGAAGLVTVAAVNWNYLVDKVKGIWQSIKDVFAPVGEWFKTKVIEPVTGFFSNMWDGVKRGASRAWEGTKEVFGTFASWFKNIFKNAWQGIVDVFSVGGEIFTNIKDGVVSAFKTVVNALITGINKVVSFPFNGINKVLKKIRDVSILGVSPFSWIGTIDVPQIPYLAQGAVLPPNKPFMAVVGDQKNGTNVEAPLATIQEALVNALEQSGGQQVNIRFTGDLAQLARVLKPVIETENRRVGVSLARG